VPTLNAMASESEQEIQEHRVHRQSRGYGGFNDRYVEDATLVERVTDARFSRCEFREVVTFLRLAVLIRSCGHGAD